MRQIWEVSISTDPSALTGRRLSVALMCAGVYGQTTRPRPKADPFSTCLNVLWDIGDNVEIDEDEGEAPWLEMSDSIQDCLLGSVFVVDVA